MFVVCTNWKAIPDFPYIFFLFFYTQHLARFEMSYNNPRAHNTSCPVL